MGLSLLTPPASEPLTLAEAKAWLRLDTDEDDALVVALVTAARLAVEARSGRKLVYQTWRWTLDCWPRARILRLPVSPVASVPGISVAVSSGAPVSLPANAFLLDNSSDPPRLTLLGGLPAPAQPLAGIAIDLQCGYSADKAAIPEPLRQAVRLMLAFLYENRGESGEPLAMPEAAAALVQPYRAWRL